MQRSLVRVVSGRDSRNALVEFRWPIPVAHEDTLGSGRVGWVTPASRRDRHLVGTDESPRFARTAGEGALTAAHSAVRTRTTSDGPTAAVCSERRPSPSSVRVVGDRHRQVLEQILAIPPSQDGTMQYRPACVRLRSGETLSRVYCVTESRWFAPESAVDFDDVVWAHESLYRLPAELATRLYAEGESGMGYTVFTLVFTDGSKLPRVTGNLVDFPALPDGITSADITDVLPHTGRDFYGDRAAEAAPTYHWLLYPAGTPLLPT